ncbi:unnamed protein product [Paramecium octaurelia]|nr:unnamed protein product [Paramecium octaurelia]
MKQSFQIKSDIQLCFKIVFLGSSSVGKTSIIKRFLKNEFAMKSMSTVGVACESKVITINNQQVKVQLWDTAGQERFRSLTKNYYRGCDAVVIVYDIQNMKSFEQVNGWIADFEDKCERPAIKMLLGNKIDLSREVGIELGQLFARKQKLLFQEVSAKENINIENAIIKLIEILIQARQIDSGDKVVRRGSLVEGKSNNGDMSNSGIKSSRPVSYKPPEKDASISDNSKLQVIKSGGESSQDESPYTSGPVLPQTSPPTIIVTPPEDTNAVSQDENNMWLDVSKKNKLMKKKSHCVSTLAVPLKLVHPRDSEVNRDEYLLRHNVNQGCFCSQRKKIQKIILNKMPKGQTTTTQKAQKAAKNARVAKKVIRARTHFQNRFHTAKPLALARKPRFTRLTRQLKPITKGLDFQNVLKHPLITEKDMKKMEDENTMVFYVNQKATKPQIKRAFSKIYEVKVRKVNILNTFGGKKKAYIRLGGENDALNLANKIGII